MYKYLIVFDGVSSTCFW